MHRTGYSVANICTPPGPIHLEHHEQTHVRVELLGQPVDRLPYVNYFPDPDALAVTVDFAQELGYRFRQTMFNGQFCTEDVVSISARYKRRR